MPFQQKQHCRFSCLSQRWIVCNSIYNLGSQWHINMTIKGLFWLNVYPQSSSWFLVQRFLCLMNWLSWLSLWNVLPLSSVGLLSLCLQAVLSSTHSLSAVSALAHPHPSPTWDERKERYLLSLVYHSRLRWDNSFDPQHLRALVWKTGPNDRSLSQTHLSAWGLCYKFFQKLTQNIITSEITISSPWVQSKFMRLRDNTHSRVLNWQGQNWLLWAFTFTGYSLYMSPHYFRNQPKSSTSMNSYLGSVRNKKAVVFCLLCFHNPSGFLV